MVGDRFFSSSFGISPLLGRGVDGVFRIHQRRKVDFRRGVRLGVLDHPASWAKPSRPDWMDRATYDRFPDRITVRELRIRVERAGFRVDKLVLATTLLDATAYAKEEVAGLYFKRRAVEPDLRSIKVDMQMDVLHCMSPETVEKEIWAHLPAYNVVRSLMADAARETGEEPRRLSFKGAMQTLRAFEEPIRGSIPSRRPDLLDARRKAIASHRVGDRPGRIEPREKKRRPKPHRRMTEPRCEARKLLLQKA